MRNRTRTGKYIDPTTDYGFKRIFGKDTSKDLLISLLNELFRGRKVIKSLEYNRNDHVGDTKGTGDVIFDLTCTDENGDRFVIEIQRTSQANLKKRMLAYGSRLVTDQIPDGDRALWNYDLKGVYVIVLMDGFNMPGGSNGNVIHDICLCDRDTKEIFQEDIGFIYVELENFLKTEEEVAESSNLDKWLYVLKYMSEMEALPTYLRKTIFEKVFQIAEYSNLTKEEREMYNASVKQKWDEQSRWETAINEGMKIEREKAEEEKKAEKLSIALNFKKSGFPMEAIARNTGLDIKIVERL